MTYQIELVTSNTANVTAMVSPAGLVTVKMMSAHRTAAELDHPDGSVTTKKLSDAAVTGAKIADKAIGKEHLKDGVVDDKAPIASPALTGTPTTPTASKGTNNDQIASTAFVAQAIAALVNSAPGTLDTLQELARALGNDANFAATVTNALAGKLGKTEKAASASNSDTLGGQPLQWIIDQINAAKTGIVASNIAPNGWVKFANGLIVQWGMGSEQLSEATQTVIFPITFSRGCFSLITGTILSVAGIRNDSMWQVATVERERAVLFHQHFTTDGIGKTKPTYIAIGV